MPEIVATVELETLAKAKAKARPEMSSDVLVIGAGPTGLESINLDTELSGRTAVSC